MSTGMISCGDLLRATYSLQSEEALPGGGKRGRHKCEEYPRLYIIHERRSEFFEAFTYEVDGVICAKLDRVLARLNEDRPAAPRVPPVDISARTIWKTPEPEAACQNQT